MLLQAGILEYIFTIGIVISFIALIIGIVNDRKNIRKVLADHKFGRKDLAIVAAILILFIVTESVFVKPTQLLFFDDVIYQAMALMMLHTGQAWMCNYGTPTMCFAGQIFHEPVGLSFNFAVGFLLFGATRATAYGTEFALGIISVFMSFFVSLLLLKNKNAAFFTELFMALSPIILVWSKPTNSDLAVLAYSLISVFFFLIFVRKKNIWSFSNMLFSFSLLLYMKVDEIFLIPVFAILYLLLNDKNVRKTLSGTFKSIRENILNTRLLMIVLFFVIAVVPSILYSYNESQTDTYGWQGTVIQNTCSNLKPVNVTGIINILNFKTNVCANVMFWFNQYKSDYVIQPIIFTLFAVLGALLMLLSAKNRRGLAAIGIWFLVFFGLYTAFYAGAVIYGVDWRFMLSLIAQASIFAGFAAAEVLDLVNYYAKRIMKKTAVVNAVALVIILAVIAYPIYRQLPLLSVQPSAIQQAADARFYENFVYNSSSSIPANCLVYSYDPTLFQLNNRTSTQIGNLYNTTQVNGYLQQNRCLVLDYGYWCHTPQNQCSYVPQSYNLVPIKLAYYKPNDYNFGFYYVQSK
jgi:Dolichyl-phosphate-mannose-protein mannosyltransferase